MIKLLMFDFDGTLVDSAEVIYNCIKKEIKKNGYIIDSKFKEDMGDWPLKEHLKRVGIKNRKEIIKNIQSDLLKHKNKIKASTNIKELRKISIEKIILSNNSEKMIKAVIKNLNIDLFKEIRSPKEFHSKAQGIRNVLKEKKLKPKQAIYIGDRDRDISAAKKVGVYSIAICNEISWSTKKEILKSEPDYIINDLSEISKIVRNLDFF